MVVVVMVGMETSKDYIAGLAAGVSTVLIGHPFDTVKVRGRISVLWRGCC